MVFLAFCGEARADTRRIREESDRRQSASRFCWWRSPVWPLPLFRALVSEGARVSRSHIGFRNLCRRSGGPGDIFSPAPRRSSIGLILCASSKPAMPTPDSPRTLGDCKAPRGENDLLTNYKEWFLFRRCAHTGPRPGDFVRSRTGRAGLIYDLLDKGICEDYLRGWSCP